MRWKIHLKNMEFILCWSLLLSMGLPWSVVDTLSIGETLTQLEKTDFSFRGCKWFLLVFDPMLRSS